MPWCKKSSWSKLKVQVHVKSSLCIVIHSFTEYTAEWKQINETADSSASEPGDQEIITDVENKKLLWTAFFLLFVLVKYSFISADETNHSLITSCGPFWGLILILKQYEGVLSLLGL